MKKYSLISLLFLLSLFSCQQNAENTPNVQADSIAVEQIDSTEGKIAKDSCAVRIELYGMDGERFKFSKSISLDSQMIMTDSDGVLDLVLPLGIFRLAVDGDSLDLSTKSYGGTEIKEKIFTRYRTVRGRIMEKDGTPLRYLPVHLQTVVRTKPVGRKRWKTAVSLEEVSFKTDSLGYYRTYVPETIHQATLHSGGLLIGTFSREEALRYPTQNFLFTPFNVRNICGYHIPEYHFYIQNKETGLSVDMSDYQAFCEYESTLDSLQKVTLVGVGKSGKFARTLRKRNGVFGVGEIRVCVQD